MQVLIVNNLFRINNYCIKHYHLIRRPKIKRVVNFINKTPSLIFLYLSLYLIKYVLIFLSLKIQLKKTKSNLKFTHHKKSNFKSTHLNWCSCFGSASLLSTSVTNPPDLWYKFIKRGGSSGSRKNVFLASRVLQSFVAIARVPRGRVTCSITAGQIKLSRECFHNWQYDFILTMCNKLCFLPIVRKIEMRF